MVTTKQQSQSTARYYLILYPRFEINILKYYSNFNTYLLIIKQVPFHIQPNSWWEIIMNISRKKKYDPLNCGTLWSYRGVEIDDATSNLKNVEFHNLGLIVDFAETPNRDYPWRTNLKAGQIPYILIWPI